MTAYIVLDLWIASISALFFCFLQKWKSENLKRLLYLGLTFIPMFFLLLLRFHIGYDYDMYMEGFHQMAQEGFSNLSYLDWEIGFVLFTKIVAIFTKNFMIYLGIIGAFCLFSSAYFIYKYSSKIWLSVILFVNLHFLYLNMNFLRQSIAIAIALFAWEFLKKRKLAPYIAIVVLASFFHITALIILIFYPLAKLKPTIGQALLYCYGLLFFYIASDGIVNIIVKQFYQEYQNSILLNGMSIIYAIIPILVVIFCIVWKEQLMALSIDNQALISLAFLTAFLTLIMTKYAILEKFSYYSLIYLIILIPQMISAVEKFGISPSFDNKQKIKVTPDSDYDGWIKQSALKRSYKRFAEKIIAIVLIITYSYNFYGMLVNVHGVFPYQMFL